MDGTYKSNWFKYTKNKEQNHETKIQQNNWAKAHKRQQNNWAKADYWSKEIKAIQLLAVKKREKNIAVHGLSQQSTSAMRNKKKKNKKEHKHKHRELGIGNCWLDIVVSIKSARIFYEWDRRFQYYSIFNSTYRWISKQESMTKSITIHITDTGDI